MLGALDAAIANNANAHSHRPPRTDSQAWELAAQYSRWAGGGCTRTICRNRTFPQVTEDGLLDSSRVKVDEPPLHV
jgi:hypothetical protein